MGAPSASADPPAGFDRPGPNDATPSRSISFQVTVAGYGATNTAGRLRYSQEPLFPSSLSICWACSISAAHAAAGLNACAPHALAYASRREDKFQVLSSKIDDHPGTLIQFE